MHRISQKPPSLGCELSLNGLHWNLVLDKATINVHNNCKGNCSIPNPAKTVFNSEKQHLVRSSQYILVCTSMYWYVLVCTSMYMYVLVHTSICLLYTSDAADE